jgi:hypothetical protein|tara:strand:- start:10655 stop:12034 length:1380 start_codon:yes stop_codon:yes gene_type:complete
MPGIINNHFRKFNAGNFIEAFGETSPDIIYLFIGKIDSWTETPVEGEYVIPAGVSPTPVYSDVLPPTPIDTVISDYKHHDNMVALKRVTAGNIKRVVKRIDYKSGIIYDEWDHTVDDFYDQNYFVTTSDFNVYKCISNNRGTASTIEPSGQSTSITEITELSDGYRWKFMYQVKTPDIQKFVTKNWIPIETLSSDDGTTHFDVQSAAVDGAIDHIDVIEVGSGYTAKPTITFTGGGGSGAVGTAVISSGVISGITINNGGTSYTTPPQITISGGGGLLATASCTVLSGEVNTIVINSGGSGYSGDPIVNIAGDGTGATAEVILQTGSIPKIRITNIGSGYRTITATIVGGGGSGCVLKGIVGPRGGHGKDAVEELGGFYVMCNVKLDGTEGGDFPISDDFRKIGLILNPTTGNGNPATALTYTHSEIDDNSGEVIYIEYRTPIIRAADQTEDIKLVAEF